MSTPVPTNSPDPAAVLTQAALSFAKALALKNSELADIIGVDPATISRLNQGKAQLRPASNEGQRALLALRSYRSLSILVNSNADHIAKWMKTKNTDLGVVPL